MNARILRRQIMLWLLHSCQIASPKEEQCKTDGNFPFLMSWFASNYNSSRSMWKSSNTFKVVKKILFYTKFSDFFDLCLHWVSVVCEYSLSWKKTSGNLNVKNLPHSKMACDLLTPGFLVLNPTSFLDINGVLLKWQFSEFDLLQPLHKWNSHHFSLLKIKRLLVCTKNSFLLSAVFLSVSTVNLEIRSSHTYTRVANVVNNSPMYFFLQTVLLAPSKCLLKWIKVDR